MPKRAVGLTVLGVKAAKKPGAYADGNGLYLHVSSGDAKSWIVRYSMGKRRRELGLGSASVISLGDARRRAAEVRKIVLDGVDPLETRDAAAQAEKIAVLKAVSFAECAKRYIAAHRSGWRNAKHTTQWTASINRYALPLLGELLVSAVETSHVMQVLEPIWATKPETASRVRGRIEAILDWATVSGFREGANPSRWKGHIQRLLPARSKVSTVEHFAALPYAELPAFFLRLQAADGMAARALEFGIMTVARTSEVLNATWKEVDLVGRLWTIPAARMKSGREHRVALSDPTVALLRKLETLGRSDYVFFGQQEAKPLSSMAMLMCLRRMDREDLTVHGFRSSFRDWCAEQTSFPSEVAEMALAHTVSSKVEAAYRRGELLEKRRVLMAEWGDFCTKL